MVFKKIKKTKLFKNAEILMHKICVNCCVNLKLLLRKKHTQRVHPSFIASVIFVAMFLLPIVVFANASDIDNTFNSTYREPPISLADRKIKEAGIPIDGISGWPVKRIDFKPEATEAQKSQAWEIVNNFDYEKELESISNIGGLLTSYGSSAPMLTADGQISVAQVSGSPYIYFRANGVTHHILGASSFEISPSETTDAISGEKMAIGDFVIGMIDKNLQNGATPEDSSLHGTWVKWSSVKAQLIEEIRSAGGLSQGMVSISGVSGEQSASFIGKIKNEINSFGISIKNGITHILNLATEKFFAKIARIERLEMVDRLTGDIYCTWIENGEWQKIKGECEPVENNTTPQSSQLQQQTPAPQQPPTIEQIPEITPPSPVELAPIAESTPVVEEEPIVHEAPTEELISVIEEPAMQETPIVETALTPEILPDIQQALPVQEQE